MFILVVVSLRSLPFRKGECSFWSTGFGLPEAILGIKWLRKIKAALENGLRSPVTWKAGQLQNLIDILGADDFYPAKKTSFVSFFIRLSLEIGWVIGAVWNRDFTPKTE